MKTLGSKKYIIATIESWNIKEAKIFIARNSHSKVLLITNKKALAYQKIKNFNPRYIFFPHWSWIIPRRIFENFECIGFHMTDLPFGRGGSPLQNLILRGFTKTKISAIKVVKELDAGPIYLKKDLSLEGSAEDIYKRASDIIFNEMIPYILEKNSKPIPQKGKVVRFKRRSPEQSNIRKLKELQKIYDYIRMLDAEGYPLAFIETPSLKIEFSGAHLEGKYILANAKISIKKEKE